MKALISALLLMAASALGYQQSVLTDEAKPVVPAKVTAPSSDIIIKGKKDTIEYRMHFMPFSIDFTPPQMYYLGPLGRTGC